MEVSPFLPAARLIADNVYEGTAERGVRVGPFAVRFDGASSNPWRNYATPDHGAAPTQAEVAALVGEFERRALTPRLEYVPAAAPAVEGALLAAGFTVEGRPPLMACAPDGGRAVPRPAGVEFVALSEDAQLLEAAAVQNAAYGEPEPAGAADVARLRATITHGGVVAAARLAGTAACAAAARDTRGSAGEGVRSELGPTGMVGAGLVTAARKGVRELAAVGVAEPFRRRGIAAALTAYLTAAAARGGTQLVFLEPAGPDEQRIYARCGFEVVGEKLWISLR